MTEYEKKWEKHIPEETREHYNKARAEMREAVKGFLPAGFLEHRQAARLRVGRPHRLPGRHRPPRANRPHHHRLLGDLL